MIPPVDVPVLSALLRARPGTRAELAGCATVGPERFAEAVHRLEELGFVVIDGDDVHVVEPDEPLAALVAAHLQEQAELGARVAELTQQLIAGLHETGRDRDGHSHPVATERVHGTRNQWDLWMRLMAQDAPRAPIAVFPDFGGLAGVVIEHLPALRHALDEIGFSLRTIARADELGDEDTREQMEAFARAGIELRTLPEVPSWFYCDAGVMVALPMEWGESVPTSIAIVREPAVMAPVQALAERLWARARPLPGAVAGWEPVLDLLAQGLSDEAVAGALGLSLRTVRRRVADASEALGAPSRFALGVEWSRRRGPR